MGLHATDIEQSGPLRLFAIGTLQAEDGLHNVIACQLCINRVARLESKKRRISCEKK